ncbi:MAG: hypothetical protein GX258_00505 [Clostridiales bacterium]|nr:hypothetical protein [Clostridiales bacterium]
MAETFLIIFGVVFLSYRVTSGIKKLEDKFDNLKLHLQEIELRLNRLDNKLDKNNRGEYL